MQSIRLRGILSLLLVISVIGVDIYTKQIVSSLDSRMDINSIVTIYVIENYGIAFSMLDELSMRGLAILNVIIIFVLLFLIVEMIRYINSSINYILGLSFVLGGCVSNFIDRLDNGSVTDFIMIHYNELYFPAIFNLADVAISIGAILILLSLIIGDHDRNKV